MFLSGRNVQVYPTRLREMMYKGHTLQLHGMQHENFNTMNDPQTIYHILKSNSDAIYNQTHLRPAYVRPPLDKCGLSCQKTLADMGLVQILFNVDTHDWEHAYRDEERHLNKEAVAIKKSMDQLNERLKQADPTKHSLILLMHDTHAFSADLADKLIDAVKAKGFRFVPLSECVKLPPYKECQFNSHGKVPKPKEHATTTTTTTTNTNTHVTPITSTTTPTTTSGAQVHQVATWTVGLGAVLAYLLV
ncbi:hypothetical protein EC968_007384 [Mortierella alpina]|nr:hypothetical protein EC968_007384 [Mortierella alpina]